MLPSTPQLLVPPRRQIVSAVTVLLADSISTAPTGAYGTQKLVAAYAGSALRVQRASDTTETDIGFVANDLDTATLATFGAATSTYDVKWYNQVSGSDLIQAGIANSPRQTISGTLQTLNGNPALLFVSAANRKLRAGAISNFISSSAWTVVTIFSVSAVPTLTAPNYDQAASVVGDSAGFWFPTGVASISAANKLIAGDWDGAAKAALPGISLSTNYVSMVKLSGGTLSAYLNGGSPTTAASGNVSDLTGLLQPGLGDTNALDGLISAILIYNVALSSADLNTLGNGAGILPSNLATRAGVSWSSIP